MAEIPPTSRQTLALILGASEYPLAPNLAHGRAFSNSANDFRRYLMEVLRLPPGNVTCLFDDQRSSSDQLLEIGRCLERSSTELINQGAEPRDLIIYYVGHGLFTSRDQAFCFAVRGTKAGCEGFSGMRASDLAGVIKTNAGFLRKFLILDCCFAASAYKEFQSGPSQAAGRKILSEFPDLGTTLLCSSSARDFSLAPQGLAHTMFSEALLTSLRKGHEQLGPRISVSELGDLIRRNLKKAFPDESIRPEVLSPEQGRGDIARIPMFPNAAYEGGVTAGTRATAVRRTLEEVAEAERRARERTSVQAREESERRTRERASAQAREEAEHRERANAQARVEAERRARERANAQARVEAERRERARAQELADDERRARAAELARQHINADRAKPKVQDSDKARRLFLLYRPRGVIGWILRTVLYFCILLTVNGSAVAFVMVCIVWPLAYWHGNKRLEQERLKQRLSELEWKIRNSNR